MQEVRLEIGEEEISSLGGRGNYLLMRRAQVHAFLGKTGLFPYGCSFVRVCNMGNDILACGEDDICRVAADDILPVVGRKNPRTVAGAGIFCGHNC